MAKLDWIVMKALEKDRKRRYETASGLAADLRQHLDHEAVLAGPAIVLGIGYEKARAANRAAAWRRWQWWWRQQVAVAVISVILRRPGRSGRHKEIRSLATKGAHRPEE